MTAGTDIKVLNKEISARLNGNWKKAKKKETISAMGVAIRIAVNETPKDSDIICQISLLPLINN